MPKVLSGVEVLCEGCDQPVFSLSGGRAWHEECWEEEHGKGK